MEVFVCAPRSRFSVEVFPNGSAVQNVLDRFVGREGMSTQDLYVTRDGRLSSPDDELQPGAVYRLEPRLCGGKGGFGSMLRALGAQIEKTTNREACRDLSGRRLRDVNHEKEMAEWLKKQSEREAEKEQRRLERLQRKLAEPKHQFTDREYQQQCLDLQERLEDSVLKGLQVSSSSQVKADDAPPAKRPHSETAGQSTQPGKKKQKMAAACFWSGEMLSSEEDSSDDEAPSSSTMSGGQGAEPECSSSCGPITAGGAAAPTEAAAAAAASSSSHHQIVTPTEEVKCKAQAKPAHVEGVWRNHGNGGPANGDHEDGGRSHGDDGPANGDGGHSHGDSGPDSGDGGPDNGDGGPDNGDAGGVPAAAGDLDLSKVSSAQELESLGLEALKRELTLRGLKCGGSLAERAARLFAVRGLAAEQVDPALLAKPGQSKKKDEGKGRSNGKKKHT